MIRVKDKILGIVFLTLLGLFIGRVLPLKFHDYQEQKRLWDHLSWLHSEQSVWKNYQVMKEEKESKAKYLKGVENYLYSESQLSEVVELLQKLSQDAKIEILHYNLGGLTADRYYLVQHLKLTVKGSYQGILTFLSSVRVAMIQRELFFTIRSYNGQLNCAIDLNFYLDPNKGRE